MTSTISEGRNICKRLKIEDGQVHDLRHTVATKMAELGISKEIRSHIFSHQSELGGVSETYNHYDFFADKLRALRLWENHLMQVVSGDYKANVVNLR